MSLSAKLEQLKLARAAKAAAAPAAAPAKPSTASKVKEQIINIRKAIDSGDHREVKKARDTAQKVLGLNKVASSSALSTVVVQPKAVQVSAKNLQANLAAKAGRSALHF